jgi:sulfofructose kinase
MAELAASMNRKPATVLVVGVSVIDFIFRLDTLPRQAEKYRAEDATIAGGGCAANAAVAIARLGGMAMLATRLGDDVVADLILGDLEKEGVDCRLAKRFAGMRSSFSSVFVTDAGERQIVNFRDGNLPQAAGWLDEAVPDRLDAVLADTRWPAGAATAMNIARRRGIPGVLDAEAPVGEAAEALALASHVAFSAQGLRDGTEAGLRAAAGNLPGWLCVTDGGNGAWWLDGDILRHVPAWRVEAVDTLGAGDVWHGAFALRLGEGAAEAEAMRFAHAVAAIKCTRFGGRSGTPTRAEAEALLAKAAACE